MTIAEEVKELREAVKLLYQTIKEKNNHPKCEYTLFEWLDEWFKTYKAPTLKDGGYDLRHTIEKHVKRNILDKPLDEYTTLDIQKGLNLVKSNRMRQITRQVYNQAFTEAVRLDIVERNPVENVKGIKHAYQNGRSLERTEEKELLRVAKKTDLYPLIVFYLLTGARPSEPLALRWEDVKAKTIRIRGTKTLKSDRILPLSKELKALLNSIPKKSEYVFPYDYQAIQKRFERLRKKLSFDCTLKDLRHTFGTRCLESGVSMKTVQKWLGHTNYTTTANIYSHITTEFEQKELEKFSKNNRII